MATRAAYSAFMRVYSDPEGAQSRGQFDDLRSAYHQRWHYYMNRNFDDLARWGPYKARYRLYRHTRSLYNPARRLVDFYAGAIYPGVLTVDAAKLPDGVQSAIPFPEDTPEELRLAVGQLWQWSNWQSGKALMVRFGAALGDVFVHVVDDVESGKVYLEALWPGLIADLDLDERGNVQAYAIEYDYNENGTRRKYRRTVDRDAIRTYRDDAPFGYDGNPAEAANPYGFVPAVWCKHTDTGGDHGEPALRNLGKWDELNSLASHAIDQTHQVLAAPILVSGTGIRRLTDNQSKRGATADMPTPEIDRESLNLLQGGENADIKTITLPAGEVLEHIDRMIAEMERDHPEIVMYSQLRQMSQVTGPGASRLFGDVEGFVNEARANYDMQSVKLFQMATAIGGMRANGGDWGTMTRQQEKFLPFGLESYAAGELDMTIEPRPLITLSPLERMSIEQMRNELEMSRRVIAGDGMTAAVQGQGGQDANIG